MSILIDSSNFVAIETFYVEETKKHGNTKFHFINSAADMKKWKDKGYSTKSELDVPVNQEPGMPEAPTRDPNKVISSLKTWWSRMSWKEQNLLLSKCMKQKTGSDGTMSVEIDALLLREMKLKTCLKKWDLTENNKEVPITPTVIDNLVPEVAQQLISEFEKITEVTEEELGESAGQPEPS